MKESEIREIVQKTVAAFRAEAHERPKVDLERAEKLCNAVLDEARRIGARAVVCVADGGGHPKVVKSMDDAYLASYDVAVNKAYTAVALKMSTATLKPLAQPSASLYGIQFTNGGKIVIFGGGEPLCDTRNEVLGGLGVSGGTEEQDTALAAFGKKVFEQEICT